MAYAPGPISIRPYYVAQQWGDYVLMADDVELGRAYSYVGLTIDAEANARLWAASPDLLEALRPFADYCAEIKNSSDRPLRLLVPFAWLEQAAAAIAKATGQEPTG